jgi:hypothetical protein
MSTLLENQRKLNKYLEFIKTTIGHIIIETNERLNKMDGLLIHYEMKLMSFENKLIESNNIYKELKVFSPSILQKPDKKYTIIESKLKKYINFLNNNILDVHREINHLVKLKESREIINITFKETRLKLNKLGIDILELKNTINKNKIKEDTLIKTQQLQYDDELHELFIKNNTIHKLLYK